MREASYQWLGRIGYREAWDIQKRLHALRLEGGAPDTLLLLEHDPVISMGPGHDPQNLLRTREEYAELGIEVVETDRGGDVTYHGPGQLVGYPIFDLRERGRDIHRYLRDVEEAIIRCLAGFGLEAGRKPPHTGVWVGDEKACAIGIKVSRWVTLHGFALNVNNDLTPFGHIVPCGITGLGVTSLALLIGSDPGIPAVREAVIGRFSEVFELEFQRVPAQTPPPQPSPSEEGQGVAVSSPSAADAGGGNLLPPPFTGGGQGVGVG